MGNVYLVMQIITFIPIVFFVITTAYALLLSIKALKIYISKNSNTWPNM